MPAVALRRPWWTSRGCHSALHQYVQLRLCPWHTRELLEVCPKCNRRIPYELSTAAFSVPYGCPCGYQFTAFSESLDCSLRPAQLSDVMVFIDWLRQVRDAHELNVETSRLLVVGNPIASSLQYVHKVLPGPRFLDCSLMGDVLVRQQTSRMISLRKSCHSAASLCNFTRWSKAAKSPTGDWPDFMVWRVEEACATIKDQLEYAFLRDHEECLSTTSFSNGLLTTINRTGSACVWACGFRLWESYFRNSCGVMYARSSRGYSMSRQSFQSELFQLWHAMLQIVRMPTNRSRQNHEFSVAVNANVCIMRWLALQAFFTALELASSGLHGRMKVNSSEAADHNFMNLTPGRGALSVGVFDTAQSIQISTASAYDTRQIRRYADRSCAVPIWQLDSAVGAEKSHERVGRLPVLAHGNNPPTFARKIRWRSMPQPLFGPQACRAHR